VFAKDRDFIFTNRDSLISSSTTDGIRRRSEIRVAAYTDLPFRQRSYGGEPLPKEHRTEEKKEEKKFRPFLDPLSAKRTEEEPKGTIIFVPHEDRGSTGRRGGGASSGMRKFFPSRGDSFRKSLFWIGAFAIFAGAGFFFSRAFARVTVSVSAAARDIPMERVVMTLDTSSIHVNSLRRAIPAERLEFSKRLAKEFVSTGKVAVEDKARGRVQIYNQFSSTPQQFVARTRFLTENNILFRLPQSLTVPGARIENGRIVPQFVEAEIVADEAGEAANMSGEVKLTIPGLKGTAKYEGFYAFAPAGFRGGRKGEAAVVSFEDRKKAEEEVTRELYEELEREVAKKIPPDFTVANGLREIAITKVSAPQEGERKETFSVDVEGGAAVIVFREEDVRSLLTQILLPEGESEIIAEGSSFTYRVRNADFDTGRAELETSGTARARTLLLIEEVRAIVRGKKRNAAADALRSNGKVADFSLSFFPPWVRIIPRDDEQVEIIIQR
jgi:hypothetical protein